MSRLEKRHHGHKLSEQQAAKIARVAHETNRGYCAALGDFTQKPWNQADDWQRDSAINGVHGIADGTITGPGDSHRAWLEEKQREGWIYGPEKDAVLKQHPCMVPFEELPRDQQAKDFIFFGLVDTLVRFEVHSA